MHIMKTRQQESSAELKYAAAAEIIMPPEGSGGCRECAKSWKQVAK